LSPNPNDAHFATGLHQDIIWQLDKLRNLNPIPRRTVLTYAGTSMTIAEIAEELDVRALLDCTVRYANERVKITAELIDAAGAQMLWQDEYEPSITELADVFAVQAEIAMNIANALSVVFTPEEFALLVKPPTVSTEAYVLMLRAYEEPDLEKEADLMRQAIAADPTYALPYAVLAFRGATQLINSNMAAAISAAERAELEAQTREDAERALSLDQDVRFARTALSMISTVNWNWTDSYERFQRARTMTPNDVSQYDIFLLSYLRRFDEAMAAAARAAQLSPNEPTENLWRGWALGYAGRYDDAAHDFTTVVERRPGAQFLLGRDWLIRMQVARGNDAAALEQLRLSEQIAGTEREAVFLPSWAYCYGRLGEAADARRIFAEMEAREAAGTRFGVGGWAMAHLAVGDQSRALEQLRVAARKAAEHEPDEGFFALMALRMNVTNDDVLRQPEFAEVLARIEGD
jgi:TolB-like protein/Tfp pilus assembly protein PilF